MAKRQIFLLGKDFHEVDENAQTIIKAHLHGPNWRRSGGWGNYLFVRQVCKWAHRLMEVWLPEPQEGQTEIDHINGVPTDNRACNLQHVTPAENRKRAVILRARRMIARQDGRPELLPENMKPEELLVLFSKYTFTNPQNID